MLNGSDRRFELWKRRYTIWGMMRYERHETLEPSSCAISFEDGPIQMTCSVNGVAWNIG